MSSVLSLIELLNSSDESLSPSELRSKLCLLRECVNEIVRLTLEHKKSKSDEIESLIRYQ
jgi:hypothetical protein